ncbi:MAG: hypothetical protein QXS85_05060 [Acidilobaceae archaeon]
MAKESGDESRHSEARREAVRVLQILSRFYSYRVLERIYGIHFQNLWRYASLLSVPERETAERILEKTRELGLLERALRERAAGSLANGGLHVLARDTGFLQLASYLVSRRLREEREERVDSVIAVSHEALTLATALALELEAEVCVASERARAEPRGVLLAHFRSRFSGEVFSLMVPKQCLDSGDSVVLVDVELREADRVSALASLARKAGARVEAIVVLRASREALAEVERDLEKSRVIEVLPEL